MLSELKTELELLDGLEPYFFKLIRWPYETHIGQNWERHKDKWMAEAIFEGGSVEGHGETRKQALKELADKVQIILNKKHGN